MEPSKVLSDAALKRVSSHSAQNIAKSVNIHRRCIKFIKHQQIHLVLCRNLII